MAVKTRRKRERGGGVMGFRFMDTGSLPTSLDLPPSLFEDHVTQTAEDLNSRFMYWRTPKIPQQPANGCIVKEHDNKL
ncbi:unnamed protein product [Sphagnum compactum]